MDDDLATPQATALLFELVGRANRSGDLAAASAALEICRAVGLELRPGEVYRVEVGGTLGQPSGEVTSERIPEEIAELVRRRDAARAARDWATADAIRAELKARGWVVKDTPQGTELIPPSH
jgi:cysteinyl-tRNA synthetase